MRGPAAALVLLAVSACGATARPGLPRGTHLEHFQAGWMPASGLRPAADRPYVVTRSSTSSVVRLDVQWNEQPGQREHEWATLAFELPAVPAAGTRIDLASATAVYAEGSPVGFRTWHPHGTAIVRTADQTRLTLELDLRSPLLLAGTVTVRASGAISEF